MHKVLTERGTSATAATIKAIECNISAQDTNRGAAATATLLLQLLALVALGSLVVSFVCQLQSYFFAGWLLYLYLYFTFIFIYDTNQPTNLLSSCLFSCELGSLAALDHNRNPRDSTEVPVGPWCL